MANHSAGETGLSESGSSSQPLAYGVHGITPAATNFLDQEGAAYFWELEAALMHGVAGTRSDEDRKPFFTTRPPTLEIFPSWPMRFQQTPKENSQPAESTDSGSAQNTISQPDSESPAVSIKASLEQPSKQQQQQQQQQQGMIAGDAPRTAAAPPNHRPRTQEKEQYIVNIDPKGRHYCLLGWDVQSPRLPAF